MIQPHHIDYLLDHLDPEERAEVELRVATDSDEAVAFERLRLTIGRLEAELDDRPPPVGLADRTLAHLERLFAHVAEPATPGYEANFDPGRVTVVADAPEPRRSLPTDRPEYRWVGGRFRGDLMVACGIGLIAVGMVLSFVNRARHASDVAACQQNLLTLHQGLSGYADTHGNRFPEIGTRAYPTADSFVSALAEAGHCPPGFHPRCPAGSVIPSRSLSSTPVTYTYSLGHRGANGAVLGPHRSTGSGEENDLVPISSDYPVASAAVAPDVTSPHAWGHNVLYLAGHVRYATTAAVGVNGDDVYRNQLGRVGAGIDRTDSVLGSGSARP